MPTLATGRRCGPASSAPQAYGMTWLATALCSSSVVLRGLSVMRPPWGNMFEFATAGATAAAVAYLLLARRNRWEWLGIFVVGPVLLTLGTACWPSTPRPPS
jgi:ABC-type transport system involved in cytochrome c biogenesis permease subunit